MGTVTTRRHGLRGLLALVGLLVLSALALSGCVVSTPASNPVVVEPVAVPLKGSVAATAHDDATRLMAKYGLSSATSPSAQTITLTAGSDYLAQAAAASRAIGLNLGNYAGQLVQVETYRLATTPGQDAQVFPTFLSSGGRVVGAYLKFGSPHGKLAALDSLGTSRAGP